MNKIILFKSVPFVKATIFSISSILGILGSIYFQLNLSSSLWLFISLLFLSIGISGEAKKSQIEFSIKFTVLGIFFIFIGYYLELFLTGYNLIYYLTIFIVVFISFLLLEKISQIKNVSQLLIYIILLAGRNFGEPDILSYEISYLLGSIIFLFVLLVFPKFSVPYKHKEFNKEELIRFFRVSLAVTLVLLIANYLDFFNPNWAALTVLVISQGTLGETIKKSIFRLTGTFFGIIVGIIAAVYLFEPYEYSRILILALFFLGLLSVQKSYTLTIFFITVGLCGLSFLVFDSNQAFLEFIIGRFLDTILGISVLIILEMIVFPYSVIKETRKFRKEYWRIICEMFTDGDTNNFKEKIINAGTVLDNAVASTKEYRYEPISLFDKNYKYQREYFAQVKKIHKIINNEYREFLKNNNIKEYMIYITDFFSKLNLQTVTKKDFEEMRPIPKELKDTELSGVIDKIILVYYRHLGFE